jgi:hypothetical protein
MASTSFIQPQYLIILPACKAYLVSTFAGHKRLRTASPGLRAMSGLGTSPGSSGGRNISSARAAAASADEQQQQSDDEMPMVQATSVAETIMDTMRSLEKVRLGWGCFPGAMDREKVVGPGAGGLQEPCVIVGIGRGCVQPGRKGERHGDCGWCWGAGVSIRWATSIETHNVHTNTFLCHHCCIGLACCIMLN